MKANQKRASAACSAFGAVHTLRQIGPFRALWESQAAVFDRPEKVQCERMKKFVNYLGEGGIALPMNPASRITVST